MNKNHISYETESPCECREDSNCGCTYPNNVQHYMSDKHNDNIINSSEVSDKKSTSAENEMWKQMSKNNWEDLDSDVFTCPYCGADKKNCACQREW